MIEPGAPQASILPSTCRLLVVLNGWWGLTFRVSIFRITGGAWLEKIPVVPRFTSYRHAVNVHTMEINRKVLARYASHTGVRQMTHDRKRPQD